MYIAILISLIVAAGLLGGTANFYLEKTTGAGYWKSLLLGLTAAATVPLFLKTVSSQLLADCLKETGRDETAFFVFFGFCTLAAIFSSKFLQSLGDKLLQEIKEVKEKQKDLTETTDALVSQNSDPSEAPPIGTIPDTVEDKDLESFKLGDPPPLVVVLNEEQRILQKLQNSRYAFRTAEGIAKDTGMEMGAVQSKLMEMEIKGMVKKTKRSRDGVMVWCLK